MFITRYSDCLDVVLHFGDIIPLIQALLDILIQSKSFIALHLLFHVIFSRCWKTPFFANPNKNGKIFLCNKFVFRYSDQSSANHNSDYPNRISYLMEDQAQQLYKEGSDFFKNGHFSEALASCNKALVLRPDYAEAWNGRGVALAELRQPAEALASYDKALSLRPDYADAWNNRGWVLVELGRDAEAVNSYDQGLALNPEDASAWFIRGAELGILGRHTEALASFDKSIAINPDDAYAWNFRGVALHELGRYTEAVTSYDKAIAINPDYSEVKLNRKMALKKQT